MKRAYGTQHQKKSTGELQIFNLLGLPTRIVTTARGWVLKFRGLVFTYEETSDWGVSKTKNPIHFQRDGVSSMGPFGISQLPREKKEKASLSLVYYEKFD